MIKVVAVAVAVLALGSAAAAADPPPLPFAARLDAARTMLRVDRDGLHGPGADVVTAAIAPARYVLIGEDHLSREIPLFATAVCRLMGPDLRAFAVEVGPEAASVVNDALRRPDRAARIAAVVAAHPDLMAFQNGVDESHMAAECARAAGPGFALWGLDQEFFGAPGYLFERMLALRPGPVARAAIERLVARDRAATARALASGSPGDLLLYTVTDRELVDAAAAIARDGGTGVERLFAALTETRAIYLGQSTDAAASNAARARLMKRTLAADLAVPSRQSRVLFKFGDNHVGRGVDARGHGDLGNFVAERAEGEGASSLHVAVFGAKGVHALYNGVGRQVRTEPFVVTDDADYAWLRDALARRDAGADWMVLDLRRLRPKPAAEMSAGWRTMIARYDLLIVAPELTPSSVLGAR